MKLSEKYFKRLQSGDRTFHEIKRYGEYCEAEGRVRVSAIGSIAREVAEDTLTTMAKEDNLYSL